MVEPYLRQTPLTHLGLPARAAAVVERAGVTLAERPHRCQVNLRGAPGDAAFLAAVRETTGLDLPLTPNTAVAAGDLAALWLGPDEWLLVAPGGREAELVDGLRRALASQHAAVTDVSEARTVIAVAGPRARELLAKGTSIDLHPREFGPGRCVQTGLAAANVILRQLDETPGYEIHVLNSFADYLWRWLEAGARDYGVAVAAS